MAGTTRHDDSDGSEIFWPGYVDATTNLILNLLFLLTILIVAVFMFALELGRTSQVEATKSEVETAGKPANSPEQMLGSLKEDSSTEESYPGASETKQDKTHVEFDSSNQQADSLTEENIVLKREIERLKTLLAERDTIDGQRGGLSKTVEASINLPKPRVGLDQASIQNAEVMIHFKDEAIDFSEEERVQLLRSLQPFANNDQATIIVEVPSGFSEAKRMGYYRAMAVRNLLLELNMTGEKIEVSVVESSGDSNASLVRVK